MWIRGNEWAWKYRRWDSVGHFREVQEKWIKWGMIFAVISIILGITLVSWMERIMMSMITNVY